jgi:glycosyltransferase involved in cell wall biosynthesis
MRFHVVSLPHAQTTHQYSACAFTEKVRKFCIMMFDRGHEVFLYSGDQNEAPCTKHFACISEAERAAAVGAKHYTQASFDYSLPHWRKFNAKVVAALHDNIQPQDFICVIGGRAHRAVADAFPGHLTVEFGIGYGGTFSKFRVFESYAWMHTVYGAQGGPNPNAAKGDHWYDAVIPGYFEVEKFPFSAEKEDYYFFIGRLGCGKGERIAAEVCKHLGKKLIVAGQGSPPEGTEYVGVIGPEKRGELMAHAKALFAPTEYIEPFGNIVPEAQACGTPTITTDWGAFTETNTHGVTGFRCRSFAEFVAAAENVGALDPQEIRKYAIDNYSLEVIGGKYEQYFQRLSSLWGKGWYELPLEVTSEIARKSAA